MSPARTAVLGDVLVEHVSEEVHLHGLGLALFVHDIDVSVVPQHFLGKITELKEWLSRVSLDGVLGFDVAWVLRVNISAVGSDGGSQ